MADPLATETQKLYGLPLAEFTAARNARAKKLKQDDPDLAAAVAGLPKPTLAAAALTKPKAAPKPARKADERRLRNAEAELEQAEARARAAERDLERATAAVEQARRAFELEEER